MVECSIQLYNISQEFKNKLLRIAVDCNSVATATMLLYRGAEMDEETYEQASSEIQAEISDDYSSLHSSLPNFSTDLNRFCAAPTTLNPSVHQSLTAASFKCVGAW